MGRLSSRLAAPVLLLSLTAAPAADPPKAVDFAHDVVPILKARCAECHTNGKYKGSLSLDTRADVLKSKAVVPGKAATSELIKRVTSNDADEQMPPKGDRADGEGGRGAPGVDRRGAAVGAGLHVQGERPTSPPLKPRRPTLPAASPGRDHPIDRILDAYFAEEQGHAARAARRRRLRSAASTST